MRIDSNLPLGVDATASSAQKKPTSAVDSAADSDRTELGHTAQKVHTLVQQALNAPEVRHDRVQQLRQAISNGAYQVSATQLAHAIVSNPV